jgi:hypothetical protein
VVAANLVVAVGLTIFYAVMRPMKKKKDPLEKSPSKFGLASQRAVEQDMNNLLVELSKMARQLTAQLDTRAIKLEMLIKQADERLAALKQLNNGAAGGMPPTNGNGSPEPTSPESPGVDERHLEVYALADERLSAQQIANKLTRPRGEIDLILALRRKVD